MVTLQGWTHHEPSHAAQATTSGVHVVIASAHPEYWQHRGRHARHMFTRARLALVGRVAVTVVLLLVASLAAYAAMDAAVAGLWLHTLVAACSVWGNALLATVVGTGIYRRGTV